MSTEKVSREHIKEIFIKKKIKPFKFSKKWNEHRSKRSFQL